MHSSEKTLTQKSTRTPCIAPPNPSIEENSAIVFREPEDVLAVRSSSRPSPSVTPTYPTRANRSELTFCSDRANTRHEHRRGVKSHPPQRQPAPRDHCK